MGRSASWETMQKLFSYEISLRNPWVDRTGQNWMVFDIDGTREAARQRALP